MIEATNNRTNVTQNETTERLGGRVQDISYWKFEVERAIQDISSNVPIFFIFHGALSFETDAAAWQRQVN